LSGGLPLRLPMSEPFRVRWVAEVRPAVEVGAAAIEYALLVAFVASLVFIGVRGFGLSLPTLFATPNTVVSDSVSGAPGKSASAPGQSGSAPGLVGNGNANSNGAANAGGNANGNAVGRNK